MAIVKQITFEGLQYNLDDKDRVAAFAAKTGDVANFVKSADTSWINVGVNDVEYTLTQPAGTLLIDCGVVLTTATIGTGDTNVKVGLSDDDDNLCAAAAMISAGVGAIGTSISVAGEHKSEGAAALVFATASQVYNASGADRTVYIRAENSATLTGGTAVAYISFIKLV